MQKHQHITQQKPKHTWWTHGEKHKGFLTSCVCSSDWLKKNLQETTWELQGCQIHLCIRSFNQHLSETYQIWSMCIGPGPGPLSVRSNSAAGPLLFGPACRGSRAEDWTVISSLKISSSTGWNSVQGRSDSSLWVAGHPRLWWSSGVWCPDLSLSSLLELKEAPYYQQWKAQWLCSKNYALLSGMSFEWLMRQSDGHAKKKKHCLMNRAHSLVWKKLNTFIWISWGPAFFTWTRPRWPRWLNVAKNIEVVQTQYMKGVTIRSQESWQESNLPTWQWSLTHSKNLIEKKMMNLDPEEQLWIQQRGSWKQSSVKIDGASLQRFVPDWLLFMHMRIQSVFKIKGRIIQLCK